MNRFFTLLLAASCLTAVGQEDCGDNNLGLPEYVQLNCQELVQLAVQGDFDSYLWSNGESTSTIEVSTSGQLSVTAERYGHALELDGDNSFAVLGNAPSLEASSLAWSGWFYFQDLENPHGLFVQSTNYAANGYYINVFSNSNTPPYQKVMFSSGGASGDNPLTQTESIECIQAQTWHYIAVTLIGDLVTIYVDGIDVTKSYSANDTPQHNILPSSSELVLGAGVTNSDELTQFMRGIADDIAIWEGVSLVPTASSCGQFSDSSGLIESWDFDEVENGENFVTTVGSNGSETHLFNSSISVQDVVAECIKCTSTAFVTVNDLPECYCGPGTLWNNESEQCVVANPADINLDGCVQLNDLLDLLSAYGDCGAEESAWQCGDPLEYQGYDYETVQIGVQCWFAENLRAENYSSGDVISANLDASEWEIATSGAVALYGNDASNLETYGRLYNWYSVEDARGLCPNDWHVPSDLEWIWLEVHAGMSETEAIGLGWRGGDEGSSLKSASAWNGSGSLGFEALPAGRVNGYGTSEQLQGCSYFWSSTPINEIGAWYRKLELTQDGIYRDGLGSWSKNGYSVRCLKDAE